MDGDGKTLFGKRCGSYLPSRIISRSNQIELLFSTDNYATKLGWNASWSAVTPGDSTTNLPELLCELFFFQSECSGASPFSPCANLEAEECHNELVIDHCCCGHCPAPHWLTLICVPDPSNLSGFNSILGKTYNSAVYRLFKLLGFLEAFLLSLRCKRLRE